MHVERDSNTKGGFLGLANNKVKTIEQYTMDGAVHTKPNFSQQQADGKSEACIKAIGGAEKQEDSWVPVLVLVLLLAVC